MTLRRFLNFICTGVILTGGLAAAYPAQTGKRKITRPTTTAAPSQPAAQNDTPSDTPADPNRPQLRREYPGMVYVHHKIDMRPVEESLMTLDGEPTPPLLTTNVTLGLVIDQEGHIITRLAGVSPGNPPINLNILTPGVNRQFPAKFIGMDSATQLCLIQIEAAALKVPDFVNPASLPAQLGVKIFGLHPRQGQSQAANVQQNRPRIHEFNATIAKAVSDFRYTTNNQFYFLQNYQLTPVQDSSLIADKTGAIFGIAVYDINNEGASLVYPVARLQEFVQQVRQSNQSLAHGWLGALGRNLPPTIATALSNTQPKNTERGVWVHAIFPDSPAETAGIQLRDLLLSINGRPVETSEQMGTALRQFPPHSEISIRLKRNNEYRVVRAKLIPAPAVEATQMIPALLRRYEAMKTKLSAMPNDAPDHDQLAAKVTTMGSIMNNMLQPAPPEVKLRVYYGLDLQPITAQLLQHFGAPNGLLIQAVTEPSKAALAGLKAGDIITKIGTIEITDLASLLRALDETPKPAQITAIRQRTSQTIELK